jgi:signal transduction histidine kinase
MTTVTDKLSEHVGPASGRSTAKPIQISEAVNVRMLAVLRCVLAFLGLVIICAGPWQVDQSMALTYGPLALYSFYSVIVALQAHRSEWAAPPPITYWADVFFYAYAIAITSGAYDFLFLFFFYPILVSAFSWGFKQGMLVTTISAVLFIVVEVTFSRSKGILDNGGPLINTAYLFLFGYMISYLGGYERFLRRKLALLKEINNQWNPRFGVDHTNTVNLERLRQFYNADSCVLVLRRPAVAQHYFMYSVVRGKSSRGTRPAELDEGAAAALMRLPDTLAACYHDPEGPRWLRYRGYSGFDFELASRTKAFRSDCAAWTNFLDARAFVTVPYSQHDGTTGRIFLTSSTSGFTDADIDFLAQASDAMATVIENMYLVEECIVSAADSERQAISRDLHDTTIQPYIGLKLALDALHREAGHDHAMSRRIAELIEMAESTVRDLRSYAQNLRDNAPLPGEFLVAAVQKQTERLGRIYGINVEIKSNISPDLKGRLAADAFQIISEGLSNVLRHSSAKNAFVDILCENAQLLLKVGNENGSGKSNGRFIPKSISERAAALGGTTYVELGPNNSTVVHVSLPM